MQQRDRPKGDRIVAVGLLTESELESVGRRLSTLYRLDDTPQFDQLLRAIDEADSRRHAPHLRCEG